MLSSRSQEVSGRWSSRARHLAVHNQLEETMRGQPPGVRHLSQQERSLAGATWPTQMLSTPLNLALIPGQ
jgi:hypothetical protein